MLTRSHTYCTIYTNKTIGFNNTTADTVSCSHYHSRVYACEDVVTDAPLLYQTDMAGAVVWFTPSVRSEGKCNLVGSQLQAQAVHKVTLRAF